MILRKNLLSSLSVFLFIVSSLLIIHPFSWSLAITIDLALLLNLIIILIATYFSIQTTLMFGLFGLLATLLFSRHLANFSIFPLLTLAATLGICYAYFIKTKRIDHKINVELDNIEEQKNILSVELKHAQLENSALKQKLQRYATLKSLTEAFSTTLSFDRAASLIIKEAFRIVGKSDVGLLYLVDKQKEKLHLIEAELKNSHQAIKVENGDMFDHWVLKQRIPLLVEDTKKDFRFNMLKTQEDTHPVRSLICAPLISQRKLLGILRLDSGLPRIYDTDDLRLLDIISDLVAVTIENALLYRQTEKLAMTDGLTGLFLHRYFQERLEQEISRALWTNSQFAFLMIDIDDFKHYNDKYGHIAGDIVLRKIAELLLSCVNPGDIVARYGGEEFSVVLVDTPKSEGQLIAEQIRERIEKEEFTLRRQTTKVRISAGLAFFPEDGRQKEVLISKADQALYRAKSEGKNRICTF